MRGLALLVVLCAACGGGVAPTESAHCELAMTEACAPLPSGPGCVCANDADCQTGFCAIGKYGGKVCTFRPVVVSVGAPCDCGGTCNLGCLEQCTDGAYCKDLGLESRCAPPEDVGGPCSVDQAGACRVGLRCVATATSRVGTCQN
jgi:hypothetical protein